MSQHNSIEKRIGHEDYEKAKAAILGNVIQLEEKEEKPSLWVCASNIEQREPTFLFDGVPDNNIWIIAGDGGVGKSLLECNLAASVTTGKASILDPNGADRKPGRVMLINAEDSFSYVVSHRLEKAGADMDLITTVNPEADELITINNKLFEAVSIIRPTLLILDPLQAFLRDGAAMERRNEMRKALAPLQKCAEENRCSVLIVMHTNKRTGAWGRNRISDSADIWDIARSVFIMGHCNDEFKTRYVSHEKCSYGEQIPTQLCRIDSNGLYRVGETDRKDYDYVSEYNKHSGGRPSVKREAAKDVIINALKQNKGSMTGEELELVGKQNDIKPSTLRRAREELINENSIRLADHYGFGSDHKTRYELADSQ